MTLQIEEIRWKSPETRPSDVQRVLLATDREELPPRVCMAYCATDRWYWYGGEPVDEPILGWAKWPRFAGPSKSSGDGA